MIMLRLTLLILTVLPSQESSLPTEIESVESCVDLDLLVGALQVVQAHWRDWTRETLARSWPGGLESGCGPAPMEQCYTFRIQRRDGRHVPQCSELFLWENLGSGNAQLGSVLVFYSTTTRPAAKRVGRRLVDAFGLPDDANRFVISASDDEYHERFQWMRISDGRPQEVRTLDWKIRPQDGVWTVDVDYTVLLY